MDLAENQPIENRFTHFLKTYYILPILGYVLSFTALYCILLMCKIVRAYPNGQNLGSWDAGFYQSIKDTGYIYIKGTACNAGFFPLFSYIWRFTHLGIVGIAAFNAALFLGSLAVLCKIYKPKTVELFLFLCLPCTFYFFIPQTESLFFLCSTLLIYGIHTEKKSVIFLAIYFATLTRASFLFFIIPFFGITLLSEPKSEVFRGKKWLEFLLIYILPILLGVGTVGLLQHVQTGNFFAYYDVQSSHWGRKLSMPLLPFGRINTPVSILNLNYLSFWLGAISIVLGAKFLYKWAVENISFSSPTQKMVVFSIGYLVMSWCSVVFLNPKWNWIDDGHGGLSTTCSVGINRYMSSNAFTLIGLLYLFDRPRLSPKMLVGLFFFTHVVWLTVVPHFYTHIQHYLKLVVVTLILIACWVYQHYKWKPLGYALALGSLYFQCILLDYFLTGTQVE